MGEWWEEEGVPPITNTSDSSILTSYPGGLVIDWQRKVAISTGRAAISGPMTVQNRENIKKLALNQALDQLSDMIGLLRIDSFTRLADLIDKDFALRDDISGLIRKSYRIVHEKVLKNEGILETTVEFDLAGKKGLSGTLFPDLLQTLPSPTPSASKEISANEEIYTGLIIDASGLGIEGGLAPKIVTPDGKEIYCLRRDTDRSALINSGFIDYSPASSDASEEVGRAGENPLMITAEKKVKGAYNCDIVIASDDAEKIADADRKFGFLNKTKVVILL